jgi:isopenicillin-N epimerase
MLSAEKLAALASQWQLEPGITYFNHGSFGPSPRPVLAARQAWHERLQRNPINFLNRELNGALAAARQRLGQFVGCPGDDLVLVDNATFAMNIVAHSLPLAAGDEVLLTDHEYGADVRIWQHRCDAVGARVVTARLPQPLSSSEEVVAAIFAHASPRTRLLVFSHVSSPTAVVLPAQAICRRARKLGLAVCIDGPHAVGMRPLNLAAHDCDYYAASCHKWLSAPLGSGFLYVHPRAQQGIRSPIVSWGTPPGKVKTWRDELVWLGTRDLSSMLAIPAALDFFDEVGWDDFREHGHSLAQLAREKISAVTELSPLVPDSLEWYGSMISLPVPPGFDQSLQVNLWERYRIEIPLTLWQDRWWIRPSCHLYTRVEDIDRLVNALRALLRG